VYTSASVSSSSRRPHPIKDDDNTGEDIARQFDGSNNNCQVR